MAQPSLSAQVAVAERALGVQLFERTGRSVRVPPAAAPLVAQARRVLVAAGDLHELARHRADPFLGTLRLGVIPTICPYLLPEIARPLARDYPDLTIEWSEERTARLVEQIKDGALDGAVLALEADLRGLAHETLGLGSLLSGGRARTSARARERSGALRRTTSTARACSCSTRGTASGIRRCSCARAPARGETGFRATSLATLVQMASASGGVTLLPSIALPVENRRGQLTVRPFAQPGPGPHPGAGLAPRLGAAPVR